MRRVMHGEIRCFGFLVLAALGALLLASAPACRTVCPCAARARSGAGASSHAAGGTAASAAPTGMPARVIYLARHGRTERNRRAQVGGQLQGDGLDPLGFKQRVGLFLLLKDVPIRAIFVSRSLRTRQTAAPLAAHLGLRARISADLDEFRGGVSEGICYSAMGKRSRAPGASTCDVASDDPLVRRAEVFLRSENRRRFKVGISYRWPGGGESLLDVDRRLAHFLRTFPRRLRDATVLIVGHSGANRFLLARLMGWPLLSALRVRQAHTAVFRIERSPTGGRPSLRVYRQGAWVSCPTPPSRRQGLSCLRRGGSAGRAQEKSR